MSSLWDASRQLRERSRQAQPGLTRPQIQHGSTASMDLHRTPSLVGSLEGFSSDSDYELPRPPSRCPPALIPSLRARHHMMDTS